MKTAHKIFTICGFLGIISACTSNTKTTEKEHITVDQKNATGSLNTTLNGKIFSIPSPIQTMTLLRKTEPNFKANLLNKVAKVDSYQTEYKRALNLGIYGADLGYSSIYLEKKHILDYIVTVEKITKSLGLESTFDKTFIDRYQKHVDNTDSMLVIVSDAFKNADLFLKNNNRKTVSALILAGGWIESLHFATALLKNNTKDKELLDRVCEQKQTLMTLIALLEENNKNNESDQLIAQLKELKIAFDTIVVNYKYAEPETNEKAHLTVLKHDISFDVQNETVNAITQQIEKIRTHITQ